MEVTQFTYFQQVGGLDCKPVLGEITYGLERLAMYLQGKESVFDLVWTPGVTYGDVYHQNEVEQSRYNFELSNAEMLFRAFQRLRGRGEAPDRSAMRAARLRDGAEVPRTPSTCSMRAARSRSPSAPPTSAACARSARAVAQAYYESRERLGFPMAEAVS